MGSKLSRTDIKLVKEFGSTVRRLRIERGWTLEMCEEKGYPSWRHLQKVESGKNVSLVTIYRLAKMFEIDASELV